MDPSGFNFDLCKRNLFLETKGHKFPKATSTGTTIAGVVFKDGIVLGADTRATNGPIVAEKNCSKIHYIADNIYCCGAGTAADTDQVTGMVSSQIELHRLATGRIPRVSTAVTLLKRHLFRYQGHISAALVLGGFDFKGPHLYTIFPHGSIDYLPYVTMGSGSLAAMGIFETGWKPNMTKEEAVKLVADAIKAGIFNDLGSGSNVDINIITKDGVEIHRPYETPNERLFRSNRGYTFQQGTTVVLKEKVQSLRALVQVSEDVMQTDN
eukprot:TRINITY_DN2868_c0_g1_i3.p1 TRINITY_DN2868_c0_g1~~TRINITY_DN2868_c0_g1_i3.p1  ORF type:complete len:267 (-),score=50.41 TRINITY_DN2868_c0_g1_i3:81-881(-)